MLYPINVSTPEICALGMLVYFGLSLFYGWLLSATRAPDDAAQRA